MTAQLLGEKRSSRRRWTLLLPLIAAFTLGMFYVAGAQAVHDDSYIQLDRNALTGDTSNGTAVPSPAAAHDWDQVYADRNDPDCTVSEADACSWNHDEPEASIFVGGGSKDTLDITGWQWKNGSVPDKDNLLDAYAARYGDDLFFGADRFDGNGTATLGVWFFQGDVGPTGTATGGGFSGTHLNNDILVLTDFQASGANATVRVFRWEVPFVTPGCSSNPCLIAGDAITPADCVGPPRVPNGDSRCGTTNARVEISPWAFTPKVGPTGFFPVGHFFEGGIDLRPFGLADSCFSTFLAETRTSNSIGSQLKDFVTGQLAHCSGAITTQVSDSAVTPGTAVHDTATVTGSNPNNDPEGDVTFFLCTFAVGSTDECDGTTGKVGTSIGTGTLAGQGGGISTADSPNVNTAASPKLPGRYCFRAEWPGDDNYPAAPPEFSAATECFTVSKIDTQAASTPVDSSGASQSTIVLGGSIYDKVDITGTTAGGAPTGSVTFSVCKLASGTCSTGGTQVGAVITTHTESGATSTYTSDAFTPTSVGRYCFRSDYGGSLVYNPSSDSGANECFTVTDTSTSTSAQDWLPNDSGTVTAGNSGTPISGTLSFTLYDSANCTGTVLRAAETFPLTNAASPATRNTTNTATTVATSKTVSWKVVFTAAAGSFLADSSHCESSDLTITN